MLRHFNSGSGVFVFLIFTCRIYCDFSSMLTTLALYKSRLRGFEAHSCKSTSKGPPSSFVELIHKLVSSFNPPSCASAAHASTYQALRAPFDWLTLSPTARRLSISLAKSILFELDQFAAPCSCAHLSGTT